ncbi:MAG: hypothetical protein ACRC7O_12685, partial [Fimbriiglobus sp.]
VKSSGTLAKIVAATEAKIPIQCPKCPQKLTRSALIPHLWQRHRLVWTRGTVRTPEGIVEAAMTAAAKADPNVGPGPLDRAFRLTAEYFPDVPPAKVFQALAARGGVVPTQLEPLLDRAADQRCGVCPSCLTPLPDPLPVLPPRLPVRGGRLVGEGLSVDVTDTPAGRTVSVSVRGGETPIPAGKRTAPRSVGALAAAPFLVGALGTAAFLPATVASPFAVSAALAGLGWLAYAAGRFLRKPAPNPVDVAVDTAWVELVPDIGKKPAALRFVARLCRTSVGAGTPDVRTDRLGDWVEWAAANSDRSPLHLQLLAASRVLQVCDGAAAGRERVAGLVGVFAPFFRGEMPAAYAEAAAETLLTAPVLTSGDAERLAVVLTGKAFESGYQPGDLTAVLGFAPWVRKLLRDPADLHLRALFWLWRTRQNRRWEEVGPAKPVFELAESSPTAARKILGQFPDVLLRLEADDAVEKELGPLLVCTSGVVAGGATVADPDSGVEIVDGGKTLRFGTHRIGLDRKLSPKVVQALRTWLRFRAQLVIPSAELVDSRSSAKAVGVLALLAVTCPLCSAVSVVRSGHRGIRWEDVQAGRVM